MSVSDSPRPSAAYEERRGRLETYFDRTALDDAVWYYPEPMEEVAGLDGYVAFGDPAVDVTASVALGEGDEATVQMPMWGTARDLVTLMDVSAHGDGTFTAPTHPDPPVGTFLDLAWHQQRRKDQDPSREECHVSPLRTAK